MTSGSRSLMIAVRRLIAACSDSSTFFGSTIDQFLPAGVIRKRDAHDVIAVCRVEVLRSATPVQRALRSAIVSVLQTANL